ncbi:hypothetical protein [Hymenobacter sublimis]|uniref:Uncharacterized protein n=1 Tax=Hymenobacter sublimis TaxID=2933777 RepID=A0ABY4JEJ6_9BACT|nr:hypothetical protein [Hymenobacter sublimis]UPL50207.1 hypothetical protein MWH26_04685 [Hymenobacter sublimis]
MTKLFTHCSLAVSLLFLGCSNQASDPQPAAIVPLNTLEVRIDGVVVPNSTSGLLRVTPRQNDLMLSVLLDKQEWVDMTVRLNAFHMKPEKVTFPSDSGYGISIYAYSSGRHTSNTCGASPDGYVQISTLDEKKPHHERDVYRHYLQSEWNQEDVRGKI